VSIPICYDDLMDGEDVKEMRGGGAKSLFFKELNYIWRLIISYIYL
jgi:hypothetical protein